MHNQAILLYHLQAIDLAITQRRARLKAIDALLSGDQTIVQATQQIEAAEKAIKPWQVRARDLELEIKTVAEKIKNTDTDLYSGKISSPKALQELQDEIAALTRQQNGLEDTLLDAMMQIEDHQGQIAAAQQTLANAQAALATQHTELLEEKQNLEAEVAQAEQKRQKSAADIDPTSLSAYEKLRLRMRGQAVALLQSDGCASCGVEQTSRIVQQVRMGRMLVYCESCGRILADNS